MLADHDHHKCDDDHHHHRHDHHHHHHHQEKEGGQRKGGANYSWSPLSLLCAILSISIFIKIVINIMQIMKIMKIIITIIIIIVITMILDSKLFLIGNLASGHLGPRADQQHELT